jgi:CRISPR-associated protein (TIGR03984 family)
MSKETTTLNFQESCLVVEHFETIGKTKAIEKASFEKEKEAFLLTYSPSRCILSRWDGNVPGEEIYEFRLFGQSRELRWVKDAPNDSGAAVFLREIPGHSTSFVSLPGRYLLWGKIKKDGVKNGVATLFEYRVGEINVPAPVEGCKEGDNLALSYLEYFKTDDYGNLTFFAERLTGVKKYEHNEAAASS